MEFSTRRSRFQYRFWMKIYLYVDPFLLWKINSQQDNSLHTTIVNLFNQLGHNYVNGKENESRQILIELSECNEVGLGNSKQARKKSR